MSVSFFTWMNKGYIKVVVFFLNSQTRMISLALNDLI